MHEYLGSLDRRILGIHIGTRFPWSMPKSNLSLFPGGFHKISWNTIQSYFSILFSGKRNLLGGSADVKWCGFGWGGIINAGRHAVLCVLA